MHLDTVSLASEYGMVVDETGGVPALETLQDGPLTVLNLFALADVARYEDGTTCPGLEAMLRYSAVSGDRLGAVGGSFVAQALPTGVVWGEDDPWDVLVVATYPSVSSPKCKSPAIRIMTCLRCLWVKNQQRGRLPGRLSNGRPFPAP